MEDGRLPLLGAARRDDAGALESGLVSLQARGSEASEAAKGADQADDDRAAAAGAGAAGDAGGATPPPPAQADDDGSMTSTYASFHDVGSEGSRTPRWSLEGPATVERVSAAAAGLSAHVDRQRAQSGPTSDQGWPQRLATPPDSPEQATGHPSAEPEGRARLAPTPSHMFESCSESEDEFGPSYRNLLHDYEQEQRQAAAVREALRAQEGSSTCSVMRRHKCIFCGLFTLLIVASSVVAVLCWFRAPWLTVKESHLRFDSLSQRQTLNGTQLYYLENPNYLGLTLEHLSVTVFYYSHNTQRWYQFDDTGDDISQSHGVRRHGNVAFTEHFSYRIRSARVASAILMQCVDGRVDLAFRGYASYRFIGQTMQRDFGPVILPSDCILTSE